MRYVPFLALLALAVAPALAQKPGADPDPEREHWRGQGVSLCVAALNPLEGFTPDESEAVCGCAFDRFMTSHEAGPLPDLDEVRLRAVMAGPILSCTIQQAPARAAAVSRWMAEQPAVAPVPLTPLSPIENAEPEKRSDAPARSLPDFGTWLHGLSLSRWLGGSGMPLWLWAPLILLGFGLLRALFGRGDGPRDLLGPPPNMRPGSRPAVTPRGPDFRPPPG
jgi:hypothetical protein